MILESGNSGAAFGLRRLCLRRGRDLRANSRRGRRRYFDKGAFFRRGLPAAPFLFMENENDNSGREREEEVIDIQAVADDNCKRLGEAVEAAFLAKVCKLRIPVCKPWGDSERYDFVVDWGKGGGLVKLCFKRGATGVRFKK